MNRKKGVFIITSHYPPNFGGVESHLKALVETLTQKHNWSVIVSTYQPLASSKKALIVENQPDLRIYRTPWAGFNIVHKLTNYPPLEFIYLFPGLFISSLVLLIKHRKEIDVIHCQGLVPTAVGVFARVFIRKRLIASVHNLYFFPNRGFYPLFARYIFSQTDRVLTPTDFSANELIKLGVPRRKIARFHYWIDLKHFKSQDRQKLKEKLQWKGFNILFIGRLIETKGVKLLLNVARNLDLNIYIKIGGDGVLKETVVKSQKQAKNIAFLGRIEYDDLVKYYGAADLVIVPSLVDEGFGFVVMEAAACGAFVVASNKGGLSEAVNSEIGVLVNPTAANFKKVLENLYRGERQSAKEIRAYALKHFSDRNVLEIIKNYEQ